MTKDEASKIISMLSMAYPHFNLKEGTIGLYAELLADIPFNVCKTATLSHISVEKYFPTIAELREKSWQLINLNKFPEPEEAWSIVLAAIKKYGQQQAPQFDCALIKDCLKESGMSWWDLCMIRVDSNVERTRFLKLYEIKLRREKDKFLEGKPVQDFVALGNGSEHPLIESSGLGE